MKKTAGYFFDGSKNGRLDDPRLELAAVGGVREALGDLAQRELAEERLVDVRQRPPEPCRRGRRSRARARARACSPRRRAAPARDLEAGDRAARPERDGRPAREIGHPVERLAPAHLRREDEALRVGRPAKVLDPEVEGLGQAARACPVARSRSIRRKRSDSKPGRFWDAVRDPLSVRRVARRAVEGRIRQPSGSSARPPPANGTAKRSALVESASSASGFEA